jgi:hypothetical protein
MILGGDIYQMHTKKRDPYLKKQRHGSRWIRFIRCRGQRHGFRGSMTDMISVLHQIDIPYTKGERLYSSNKTRGAAPREEWPFAIDVKGGEIITLM